MQWGPEVASVGADRGGLCCMCAAAAHRLLCWHCFPRRPPLHHQISARLVPQLHSQPPSAPLLCHDYPSPAVNGCSIRKWMPKKHQNADQELLPSSDICDKGRKAHFSPFPTMHKGMLFISRGNLGPPQIRSKDHIKKIGPNGGNEVSQSSGKFEANFRCTTFCRLVTHPTRPCAPLEVL